MSTITRAAITGSSVKDGFVLEAPVLDEELQVDDDDHLGDDGDHLGGGHGHGVGGGDEPAQRMRRCIPKVWFPSGFDGFNNRTQSLGTWWLYTMGRRSTFVTLGDICHLLTLVGL